MKQVLIIAEGKVAKIFIEFLLEKYYNTNFYTIVSTDSAILGLDFKSNFSLLKLEPTSPFFLSPLIDRNLYSIFVIVPNSAKCGEICHIIRNLSKEIPIILSCKQKSSLNPKLREDSNISTISMDFLGAKSLIEKVPNIPIVARGFGLNKGEIMQINIPFGSAYAYISVGSILQKGWSIAGIYRQNSFLLVNSTTIILPNDSILAVGEPRILNKIHKRISNNKNNFPAPFGNDIFAYIDFRADKKEIENIITDALWLHKKINNDNLVITVLNPSDIAMLDKIKNLANGNIRVIIDYDKQSPIQKIASDSSQKMGLIIAPSDIFKTRENRRILYKANRPILKVGKTTRLSEVGDSLVIANTLANAPHTQNIAYTIVDISSQLNLQIRLYEFEMDGEYDEILSTYYRNLGRIFNKKVYINRTHAKNPLFWLYQQKVLQFIPLEISLIQSKVRWLLDKNANFLSLFIHKNPQILLPI